GTGAAPQECAGRTPLARMGVEPKWRGDAHARRAEPLERRKGSVVGTASPGPRVRSEVRPSAGQSVSSRDGLPALAARQTTERLPLRPARSHEGLRARARLRGASAGLNA